MTREPFGDVELMLEDYLGDLGLVVTQVPIDLKDRLESGYVIAVNRNGGGESANGTVDNPRVRVAVFALRSAAKPRDAHDGASLVRQRILNLPAITPFGRIDSGVTEAGPTAYQWPDPQVAAVQQIFRLSTRR